VADFVMPSLGADMEHGTLVEWMVEPGQQVTKGDLIAVIETDKGAIEVEVWSTGTVEQLCVDVGVEAEIGTVLARIREPGDPPAEATAPTPASTEAEKPKPAPTPAPSTVPAAAPPTAAGRASPWARHLASQRGVSLSGVAGTGPDGAIIGVDVPQAKATPARAKGSDLDAMRRAVARAMAKSKREIPHYYLSTEVDMTPTLAWLSRTNAALPPPERLLPALLLIRAAAKAAREVPQLNGFWRDDQLEMADAVHIGVAVALRGGGLVAPALHDADSKPLPALMAALSDLVRRARRGRLRGSEMTDATLTTTSMGDRGVERVDGVIYPPQVAIVGFGRITERPWVVDGAVVPRQGMTVSLAGDHRAHDGHLGARYLSVLCEHLRNPEAL